MTHIEGAIGVLLQGSKANCDGKRNKDVNVRLRCRWRCKLLLLCGERSNWSLAARPKIWPWQDGITQGWLALILAPAAVGDHLRPSFGRAVMQHVHDRCATFSPHRDRLLVILKLAFLALTLGPLLGPVCPSSLCLGMETCRPGKQNTNIKHQSLFHPLPSLFQAVIAIPAHGKFRNSVNIKKPGENLVKTWWKLEPWWKPGEI